MHHDDVIKWKHFPRYWPFVQGIHRLPVNSQAKTSDADLWYLFDLRMNKRLSKQAWGWWLETPSGPLWRHCNVNMRTLPTKILFTSQSIPPEWPDQQINQGFHSRIYILRDRCNIKGYPNPNPSATKLMLNSNPAKSCFSVDQSFWHLAHSTTLILW